MSFPRCDSLQCRLIIIAGGATGIGAAFTLAFHQDDFRVDR